MQKPDRSMRTRTMCLDPEADEYLRVLCPRRTGIGAIISRLVLEHKIRQELAQDRRVPVTQDDWLRTGVCVD